MVSAEKYSERSTYVTEIQGNSTPINAHFSQPSNSSTLLQGRSESRIIPIFKNNILQLNVNVTKILAEKRQQSFAASLISGNNVGVMVKSGTSHLQRPVPCVTNTKAALAQQQPATKHSGNPVSHTSFTSNGNALLMGNPGMLRPQFSTNKAPTPGLQKFGRDGKGSRSRPANLTTKANYRPILTQLSTNIRQSCSEGTALGLPFSQQRMYCSSQPAMVSAEKYSERSKYVTEIQGNSTPINAHFTQPSNSSTLLQGRSESRIIPIFKNNILQLNVNVTKILAEKRQQSFAAASLISGNNVGVMVKSGTSHLQRPVPCVTNTKAALAQQQPATKHSGNPVSHTSFTSNGNALLMGNPGMLRPQFSTNKAPTPGLQKFGRDGKTTDVFTQNRSNQSGTVPAKPMGSGPLVTQPEKKNESVKRKPQESGLESKPKKPRAKAAVQDVDVEEYARNNQLLKVNSITLQAWLKMRGISVKAKDKKEELVSKIMQCISEP
ncbi:UNVERIFIED_CONTAM: hypothetical protein FKN15_043820 [Acipenser sinensis]